MEPLTSPLLDLASMPSAQLQFCCRACRLSPAESMAGACSVCTSRSGRFATSVRRKRSCQSRSEPSRPSSCSAGRVRVSGSVRVLRLSGPVSVPGLSRTTRPSQIRAPPRFRARSLEPVTHSTDLRGFGRAVDVEPHSKGRVRGSNCATWTSLYRSFPVFPAACSRALEVTKSETC